MLLSHKGCHFQPVCFILMINRKSVFSITGKSLVSRILAEKYDFAPAAGFVPRVE
jgi:hypothetical protein